MAFDTDLAGALIGVLRDATGPPDLEYEREPEPMRGGFWAEILSFSLAHPAGDRVTVLDWSAALLGPRAYDVGFTSLLLSEPPLRVPGWQRPLIRAFGVLLGRRFVRGYQRATGVTVPPGELRWYQAVVCLRALVDVASWTRQGVVDRYAGHPWLASGPAFARRLTALTGAPVQPR